MSTESLKAVVTGQAVQRPTNIAELSKFLAGRMTQIKSVIARNLTPEKMARIALNELRNSDFLMKIAIQNPESFVNAVVQASHLGLEIGGTLGQAYLVPFKGEIKMMPGYRGLIALARRSGEVTSINAEIVYDNDEFDLELGINTKMTHKPRLDGPRGEPRLAYMVAHFKDGGFHFEWMGIEEIMLIKQRSSAVQSGIKSGKLTPWDTDRDEMIRKTVIRRGWKYLPMSIEMQSAAIIESANEQGKNVVIEGESVLVSNSDSESGDHGAGDSTDGAPADVIDIQTNKTAQAEQQGQDKPEPDKYAKERESIAACATMGALASVMNGMTPKAKAALKDDLATKSASLKAPQQQGVIVTYAEIAGKLKAAKTADAVDEAGSLIGEIADPKQRAELDELFVRAKKEFPF